MAIFRGRQPDNGKRRANLARILALVLVLVLLSGTLSGCKKEEPETVPEGVIRIGILEPVTGSESEGASAEVRGIKLANQMRSEVNGMKIELVYADNESSLKKAVTAAETLVSKGCVAAIGSYGNMLTLASANTLRNAQIPLVNATGTNPLLTGSSPYLFRTATVETDQAQAALSYLRDVLGLNSYAILLPAGDDFAQSMADEFCEAAGYACKTVFYTAGTDDFSLQVAALRSCDVEAVYLPGNAEDTASFLKAAKTQGMRWTCFGTQRLKNDAFLELAFGIAEGLYTTGDWDPLVSYTESSKTFLRAYRLHYGQDAVPTEAEALGYEAYMLLLDALGRSESMSGFDIRSALSKTESFAGVTGLATMDKEGDLNREQTVWMIAEGAYVNPKTYIPPKENPLAVSEDEE